MAGVRGPAFVQGPAQGGLGDKAAGWRAAACARLPGAAPLPCPTRRRLSPPTLLCGSALRLFAPQAALELFPAAGISAVTSGTHRQWLGADVGRVKVLLFTDKADPPALFRALRCGGSRVLSCGGAGAAAWARPARCPACSCNLGLSLSLPRSLPPAPPPHTRPPAAATSGPSSSTLGWCPAPRQKS